MYIYGVVSEKIHNTFENQAKSNTIAFAPFCIFEGIFCFSQFTLQLLKGMSR